MQYFSVSNIDGIGKKGGASQVRGEKSLAFMRFELGTPGFFHRFTHFEYVVFLRFFILVRDATDLRKPRGLPCKDLVGTIR